MAQNRLHISQILNFNVEHGDMPNIQNFREELDSKNFKKRIHFLILKQTQPTIFFDLLGVAIFRVTLRVRAHIFVKMVTVRRNDVTQFVFIFPTRIKCDKLKNVT